MAPRYYPFINNLPLKIHGEAMGSDATEEITATTKEGLGIADFYEPFSDIGLLEMYQNLIGPAGRFTPAERERFGKDAILHILEKYPDGQERWQRLFSIATHPEVPETIRENAFAELLNGKMNYQELRTFARRSYLGASYSKASYSKASFEERAWKKLLDTMLERRDFGLFFNVARGDGFFQGYAVHQHKLHLSDSLAPDCARKYMKSEEFAQKIVEKIGGFLAEVESGRKDASTISLELLDIFKCRNYLGGKAVEAVSATHHQLAELLTSRKKQREEIENRKMRITAVCDNELFDIEKSSKTLVDDKPKWYQMGIWIKWNRRMNQLKLAGGKAEETRNNALAALQRS